MRDTSVEAYRKIKEQGLLSHRRWEIYEWLYKSGPATANQIFKGIRGLSSINQANVPARLNEMREMGVVKELGTTVCPMTKMRVIQWEVTSQLPKLGHPTLATTTKAQKWYIVATANLWGMEGQAFENKIMAENYAAKHGGKIVEAKS